mgnify:CR=1 FL=1
MGTNRLLPSCRFLCSHANSLYRLYNAYLIIFLQFKLQIMISKIFNFKTFILGLLLILTGSILKILNFSNDNLSLLFLIVGFVLVMHNRPDWWSSLTHWLHIRTSMLRPEISVIELMILIGVLFIIFKLYF